MVKISSEDILKLSAAGCGIFAVQLAAAPEWSHNWYMSKTAARSDCLMQYIGNSCAGVALAHLALANAPGDKKEALKATAICWAGCGALQLYHGLKTKKQKKEQAIANAVASAGIVGLCALKLNGNI